MKTMESLTDYDHLRKTSHTSNANFEDWNERIGCWDEPCKTAALEGWNAANSLYESGQNQVLDLILTDPDGGRMVIVSDLETLADNSVRFEVANPDTGQRFGVVLGLAELTPLKGFE